MYSVCYIESIEKSISSFPCTHKALSFIIFTLLSTRTTTTRRFNHSSCPPNNINRNTTIHNINFARNTIQTTVTTNADSITKWITETISIHKLKGNKLTVGLDIEWKPKYRKHTNNKVATLELCINNRCLIIQVIYLNTIPRSLKDFLSTKLHGDVTFVGVAVESDAAKLEKECGLKCGKMKDLQKIEGTHRQQQIGLKSLAREVIELVIDKPKTVTMSNWEARVVSAAQVEYVCIDAYASYRIANRLMV